MPAFILDGKEVAASIKQQLKLEIDAIRAQVSALNDKSWRERGNPMEYADPTLAVVIVGEDPASQVYVNSKHKTCLELGINSEVIRLPADVTEEELMKTVHRLNADAEVHGILVQMPLPKHIDTNRVINAIWPEKDVDGFSPVNVGNLVIGREGMIPCTPHGIMKMLEYYKIGISGKKAVVIGRSNIVGKPIATLLQAANATVTVCHTKTGASQIKKLCREADIIIVATGVPNSLTADMLSKPRAQVIIDVGINRIDGKLCGDVDFENVKEVAGYITPVPGGVGPLTIAMLMFNTIAAYKQQTK